MELTVFDLSTGPRTDGQPSAPGSASKAAGTGIAGAAPSARPRTAMKRLAGSCLILLLVGMVAIPLPTSDGAPTVLTPPGPMPAPGPVSVPVSASDDAGC